MSVSVAVTVDVEGEWFGVPGEQGVFDVDHVLQAVAMLERQLELTEEYFQSRMPVTWFVRCDDSVEGTTGSGHGLLAALETFIARRLGRGDEFGVHPHLYRLERGKWGPELDVDRQVDQVRRAIEGWKSYFGDGPKLSRMGEAIMNNDIASALSSAGIVADSSALPGRARNDSGFQFDWIGAPNNSYRPSKHDYRQPAVLTEDAHGFVEVPFTMLPIRGPNDPVPLSRYCNLAYRPELVRQALANTSGQKKIVAVVHPHELAPSQTSHPLIGHDPAAFKKNVSAVAEHVGRAEFVLLSQFV